MKWISNNRVLITGSSFAIAIINAAIGFYTNLSHDFIGLIPMLVICPLYGVYILWSVSYNREYYFGARSVNSEGSAPFGVMNYLCISLALFLIFLPLALAT